MNKLIVQTSTCAIYLNTDNMTIAFQFYDANDDTIYEIGTEKWSKRTFTQNEGK